MNDRELKLSLAELARTSPESWKRFLRQYDEYNNTLIKQLISSPPEVVQVAQGRARQGEEFSRILHSCLADADAIAAKERTTQNVRPDRRV